MVYIAPLSKATARRPRVQNQQVDEQQHASSTGAVCSPGGQQQQHQQEQEQLVQQRRHTNQQQKHKQQQQPRRSSTAIKHTAGRAKQQTAQDQEPDPQQLLAYQAALATQVLHREQAAVHSLHQQDSTSNTQQLCGQQQLQPPPHYGSPGVPSLSSSGRESRHGMSHTSSSKQAGHQAPRSTAAAQHAQQPMQQQKSARQQQQQSQVLPQQRQDQQKAVSGSDRAKKSQNHRFFDVAPKTISPSQVPGLTDGPAIAHPADAAECASQISTEGGSTIQQRKQQKQRQQPALTPPSPPQQQQQQQVRVQVMPQQQDSLGHLHADALQQDDTGAWSGSHFQQPQQHGQHQRAATQPDPQSSAGSPSRHPAQQQQQQGLQQQHQDSLASQQHHHHQHQQQQQSTSAADRAAELSEALRAAEAHTDHGTRQRLMKDIKQQQYKLELEQQIAEREAARRAGKVAAAARDAADAAARAAAPPPWDPAAKLGRRGGGGEPLKGVNGAPVTDLRNQRHMLPVPGLEPSHPDDVGSTTSSPQHTHTAHTAGVPAGASCGHSPVAAAAAAAEGGGGNSSSSPGMSASVQAVGAPDVGYSNRTAPINAAAGDPALKGFMSSLAELRPGPSQEQRAAATAARLQLQRDLEAQVAEKAARAAALAATEAARAAAEDAALQHYLLTKSSSQADVGVVGKEASVVSAAAGLLNVPAGPLAAAAAAAVVGSGGSNAGGHGVQQRRGRSKRVIDAPWLDQLKPAHQQHSQLHVPLHEQHTSQQQVSQLQLQHMLPQQQSQSQLTAGPALCSSRQLAGELWQETSSFRLSAAGAGAESGSGRGLVPGGVPIVHSSTAGGHLASSGQPPAAQHVSALHQSHTSQQLSAALQEVQHLQQEQLRMWEDFRHQAQDLQQMLCDKQAAAADRDAERAELGRVQELLQQQKQLQEAYAIQQQALLGLQQQQQQQQPYHAMQVSPRQSDMLDCLDAFVVETQMVPISVNNIPNSGADTQAVSDLSPTHGQDRSDRPEQPEATSTAAAPPGGRHHKSRCSSFYGLEAELSSISVVSQPHSPKANRKARTRVSTSSKPTGHSVNSSLAASTSFVPFTLHRQLHEQELQQPESEFVPEEVVAAAASSPKRAHRRSKAAGAAAVAAAAAGPLSWPKGLGGSSGGGRGGNRGSPPAAAGSSPNRGRGNARVH